MTIVSKSKQLELATFRTDLCVSKMAFNKCSSGEDCAFSHCISWTRRNPFAHAYRSSLCPNTRFWQENKRMRVKTWCKRGRNCLFSHTKEEQMYHPEVYKTQVCHSYPNCNKPFCPFAHGTAELRFPELTNSFKCIEGPELIEAEVAKFYEFEKTKDHIHNKQNLTSQKNAQALEERIKNFLSQPDSPSLSLLYEHKNCIKLGLINLDNAQVLMNGMVAVQLKLIKN